MEHMTTEVPTRATDRHAGHKLSPARASHEGHAGHSVAAFRDKFWLSLTLTIPVIFWSTDVQHWLGYRAPSFPGSNLIAPFLGTFVFVYGGLVFVQRGTARTRHVALEAALGGGSVVATSATCGLVCRVGSFQDFSYLLCTSSEACSDGSILRLLGALYGL